MIYTDWSNTDGLKQTKSNKWNDTSEAVLPRIFVIGYEILSFTFRYCRFDENRLWQTGCKGLSDLVCNTLSDRENYFWHIRQIVRQGFSAQPVISPPPPARHLLVGSYCRLNFPWTEPCRIMSEPYAVGISGSLAYFAITATLMQYQSGN